MKAYQLAVIVGLICASINIATAGKTDTHSQAVADLKYLSDPRLQGRATGSEGSQRAREYIAERFQQLSLATLLELDRFFHGFNYQSGFNSISGVNVIGVVAGAQLSPSTIVITAHYDHIGRFQGRIHPGADDNASGVAVLLALAARAIQQPLQHRLMFLATDAEEKGLIGAKAFFADARINKVGIQANLNLDMVAQMGKRKRLYVTGEKTHNAFNGLVKQLNQEVSERLGIRLVKEHRNKRVGRAIANGINYHRASDHAVFADNDIAYLFLGVAEHRFYHTPNDTFEKIDLNAFDDVVEVAWALLQQMDQRLHMSYQ